jgi:hypothetical protein
MIMLLAALASVAVGIAAYFLLLMADARKLRERMFGRHPFFIPDERPAEEPLITSDHASWVAPPFRSVTPPSLGSRGSLYSTTPGSPGAD